MRESKGGTVHNMCNEGGSDAKGATPEGVSIGCLPCAQSVRFFLRPARFFITSGTLGTGWAAARRAASSRTMLKRLYMHEWCAYDGQLYPSLSESSAPVF